MTDEKAVKQQDERLRKFRSVLGTKKKEETTSPVSREDVQSDMLELDSDTDLEGLVDSITITDKLKTKV